MLHFLVALAVLATSALAGPSDAPVVSVAEGQVSGVVEASTRGKEFFSYYGVPFASPPVGELRLKDPVKAKGWKGIRDGSLKPSPCLQVPFEYAVSGITLAPEDLVGSEDCLYLNVFTPKRAEAGEKLPVMVWIHGGAFFAGGAHEYLPHVLMNRDIVLVVLQYRLGVLGFLSTEDDVIPGNFGLKDQTLALQWVQENIHNFGGDASRVTIFGESAGGASVHFQMLSPKAKGLFSRVIMQSGSAIAPWAIGTGLRNVAVNISKSLGCRGHSESEEVLKCLQNSDAREIAATFQDFVTWFIMPLVSLPRVDGDFIPDEPAKLVREGKVNHVNLMAGITRDEGGLVTQSMIRREDLTRELRDNFQVTGPVNLVLDDEVPDPVSYSRKVFEYFLGELAFDDEHMEQLTRLNSVVAFEVPLDLTTQYHAKVPGVSTYRYTLEHRGQLSFGDYSETEIGHHWIPHADDLFYLFAGGPLLAPDVIPDRPKDLQKEEDLRLREIMMTLWVNFAATGNPTPDGSLGFRWKPSTPEELHYLSLTPTPEMKPDQRQKVREFMNTLPNKVNKHLHPERVHEDISRPTPDEL